MCSLVVVVMAAGRGTRMKSDVPKVLHHLGGQTILESVVAAAVDLQPRQVVVIYGYGGEQVPDVCGHLPVTWIRQEEQLGTGHAVTQAVPEIANSDTVLILVGDMPLIRSSTLELVVEAASGDSIGLVTVNLDDPDGYGRVVRDESGKVLSIVEQRDATQSQLMINEVNAGIFALSGRRLKRWLLSLGCDNTQGEYYLTDIIGFAVEEGVEVKTVQASKAHEVTGINDRRQLAVAERCYQLGRVRELMMQGVTFRDPARADLRGNVSVGRDVTIDVNVILEGDVTLGDRVSVGPNTVIRDSVLESDVEILANCVIESSYVGSDSRIGPFARLRPDSKLAKAVQVGNFVEVKKSTIGPGSKVNHLSYVGDAEIGTQVNIGAGTITCNYDGSNKHKTVIGDGAFVGSGTELVAPVEIGSEAIIGAGSTITKNAEPGRLTLSRARQTTIANWKKTSKS